MKLQVKCVKEYDTNDPEFYEDFLQYMDDHPLTFSALHEFILDRFINPNFDSPTVSIEIAGP